MSPVRLCLIMPRPHPGAERCDGNLEVMSRLCDCIRRKPPTIRRAFDRGNFAPTFCPLFLLACNDCVENMQVPLQPAPSDTMRSKRHAAQSKFRFFYFLNSTF